MWKDLAPTITRQRLVVEGTYKQAPNDQKLREFLVGLSDALGMTVLAEPVTHKSEKFGWAAWVHWESSGCHVYAWSQPELFFSVDIYTCKVFDEDTAVAFTKEFFEADTVVWKSF